jgi:mannan endo-1,4-beta-mannosidase
MIRTFVFRLSNSLVFCLITIVAWLVISCSPLQNKPTEMPIVTNPNATTETVNLFYNLKNLAPDYILFGHEDATAYGIGWKDEDFRTDIHDVCGDHPAVFGWDIGKIGNELNIDSVPFERMKYWMIKAFEKGGVNTVSWHMDNLVTGGDSWDCTERVVEHILPGGSHHNAYLNKLEHTAAFLSSLKTANGTLVPVIFRPFHEHTGSWFWWGEKHVSRENYIALWHFTYNYLVNEKKVNNLLWAYSPDRFYTKEKYLERFPGKEYVDIIGFDNYYEFGKIDRVPLAIKQLRMVVEIADSLDKIPALTETGLNGIPDPNWWTGSLLNPILNDSVARRIAWILVWRNYDQEHHFAPYPGHSSEEDFKKFFDNPATLFLRDLPDLYASPLAAD